MTYEQLKEQLIRFFSDTGNSREQTRDGLEKLRDEIDFMLSALREDDDE